SWTYGEGIVHHCAFQVDDYDAQDQMKFHLEGMGFTDVSERKNRGYFDSIYVRTPAGALFEATVSKQGGLTVDESVDKLGTSFQLPGPFPHRPKELPAYLEPLNYRAAGSMLRFAETEPDLLRRSRLLRSRRGASRHGLSCSARRRRPTRGSRRGPPGTAWG